MKVRSVTTLSIAGSIAFLILVAGCDLLDPSPGNPGPSGNPVSPNKTVSLEIGARLFADNCARCHGDSAQGTTVAINIQGISGIRAIVRSGNALMPAFPNFSDADISSIGLFLSKLTPAGIDTLQGAPLYAALCARCHGDSAQGIVGKGPGLALETGIATVVRSGRNSMPAFANLTDQQIASLEKFFAAVPFERTGRNLFVRYCITCHGADAGGVRGKGPDIRDKSTHDIQEAIREGEGGMPRFPQLNSTDVQRIREYIQSL